MLFQPLLRAALRSSIVLSCCAIAGFAAKAEEAAPAKPLTMTQLKDHVKHDLERLDEFFDTRLPGTLARYNLELKFSPKFGDFRDYEFVRLPFELRYGVGDNTELYGGMTPYIANPINKGREHSYGLGEGKLGVRHDFGRLLWFYNESTIGIEGRTPLGKPPLQIIDGYSHIRPFVTGSRNLKHVPDTQFYTNFSYDREVSTPHRESPVTISKMHVAEIGPGLFYKPNEFGAFAEYRFQFITTDAGTHHAHNRKVGVVWDVPLARSQRLKLPGKWKLELAYKFNHEKGFDDDRGLVARVSWRTSLREVMDVADRMTSGK